MKVTFKYDLKKDIWCILNYGRSSQNSNTQTKVYEEIVALYGAAFTEDQVTEFLKNYYIQNHIILEEHVASYQKEWEGISQTFKSRAEAIFGSSLSGEITVYLTANNRCPYNLNEKFFFVSVPTYSMRKTVMHELWHFYTWEIFGREEEARLGRLKYNDIKESLTVLLNLEFESLLEGKMDNGYPQHKELRDKILELYKSGKSVKEIWGLLS